MEMRLAIVPRPRGQDWLPHDINLLQRAGIDAVVSALTAAENEELGLVEESRCCQSKGIEFLSFLSKTDPFRIHPLNLLN
jgi:hypothetical protein